MTITKPRTRPAPAASLFAGQSTTAPGAADQPTDDFVVDVVRRVRDLIPAATEDQLADLGAGIRQDWGGDRPYIARRAGLGRSERNEQIRRDHRRGVSVAVLQRRYEVSRITVWRVIGIKD